MRESNVTVPRNTPDDHILRMYEKDVLDVFHRTLPLWKRPRPQAIFATLAAFDLLNAPTGLALAGCNAAPRPVQHMKWLHDSLIYALRFFWDDQQFQRIDSDVSAETIQEAMQFLMHAKDYALLVDFHTGLNRGLYRVETNEAARTVRFVPIELAGASPDPAGLLDTFPGYWRHMSKVTQHGRLKGQELITAVREVPSHFETGRVVLDDPSLLRADVVNDLVTLLAPPEKQRLQDTADLGDFSSSEFHCLWNAVFAWSVTAFGAYLDAWFSGLEQYDHLPTQFVDGGKLGEHLSCMSGVPREQVARILDRLTFGQACTRKPDVFLQPFLASDRSFAWSPYLIQLAFPERNMLKLMARLPHLKAIADNLIALQEHSVIAEFAQLLNQHGFEFKKHTDLPDGSGEIDLMLIHSRRPDEVLLVEAKGVLGPDEVNEVGSNTQTQKEGQGQLERAIDALQSYSTDERQRLWKRPDWNRVTKYFGIVLTPDSAPNATYDHSHFPAITMQAAQEHLRRRDFKSPARVWKACVEKEWLTEFKNAETAFESINIGTVTYEIPAARRELSGE